jgi:isocitrate/isopropylmalate dehydrogenase
MFEWEVFPWSCEYYRETGKMMPDDGLSRIRNHDAIFLGAVGYPGVPDHISLWGLLIPIRRTFEQYANVRPVRLMPGIQSPLVGRESGSIDGAMMLEHLGETDAANAIVRAIESTLQSGTMTRDIGGSASTDEAGNAIALAVESGV